MPKTANADTSILPNLGLKQLVDQVLERLGTPHGENIVEDVFLAIEGDPTWRASYDRMVYQSGKASVTSWASYWISHAANRTGDQRESASRSTLIDSYARLVQPAPKRGKKVKEPAALQALREHFVAHRAELPQDIRSYREMILTLIMDGIDTESAFAQAIERPSFAW
ncbi:MAG TPA: hypothetical protein VFV90_08115 [Usitatibacter sp.]|jgi:hypothetical protein|nr:hypothetical protein [Usitatibacter sp.]